MKQIKKGIGLFLVIQVLVLYVWDISIIAAENNQQSQVIQYSGVLERNQKASNDSFLATLSFPHDSTVKVTLELDLAKCTEGSGGHVQFAFTKDEAHSLWADDIGLIPNVMETYTETFSLYAGTYVFEMHLIRDEDACIPWRVKMETSDNHDLPAIDKEATCRFQDSWVNPKLKLEKKKRVIDLYEKLFFSSWREFESKDIIYTSSNKKVATVSKIGKLNIRKAGKTIITVELPNGFTTQTTFLIQRERKEYN